MDKEKRNRCTAGERVKRISEIAQMLIQGRSREAVLQFTAENWTIGERTTDTMLADARKLIAETVIKDVNYDYALAIARLNSLFIQCQERRDYRTCVTIVKEMAALQGLAKMQVEHSGQVTFISNIPE